MAKEKCPENELIPLRVTSCLSGIASKKSLRRATASDETGVNPKYSRNYFKNGENSRDSSKDPKDGKM
ncbi:MAG TPA: hypothetical protein VMM56_15455 [Planctomycetaceae bacterium]|nr:hypothetical protein [Planctomycetaceae bacterium]